MIYPKPKKHKELLPQELRWYCDPSVFDFESTENLKPIEGILGQERALKAIRLGISMRSPGYNIYIAGLSGTGKASTVKKMLESMSTVCPELHDYVYVNNFKDPDRPVLLIFHKGTAKKFKQDINATIELLKKRIPRSLEVESYINRRNKIINQYNEKEQTLIDAFESKISQENFKLGEIKVGESSRPELLYVLDKNLLPVQQIEDQVTAGKISKEEADEVVKKYNSFSQELQEIFKKGLKLSQEYQEKLFKLEQDTAKNVIEAAIDNLKETYTDQKVLDYINQLELNILDNVHLFKGTAKEEPETQEGFIIDYFRDYEVNIILDNSDNVNCPVVNETSPIFMNIFGSIEKQYDGRGGYYSDFTNIKSGSLLAANGGYLVLNVNHLFEEPGIWKKLKRALTYRLLEIQDPYYHTQYSPSSLKPEPIPIDTKVILLGSQNIYSYLAAYEYDFKKIFKIKADFDYEIEIDDSVLVEYAQVIKKLIKEENLLEFDKYALSNLIELSARLAGSKHKLTTRFSRIADIAREANYWAVYDKSPIVKIEHIIKAYREAKERHGMLEAKVTEMFDKETFLIDTEGKRVGQINGLAVYEADFYSFGRPTRITSTVSLGSGYIINVEREAGMSGKHYNKGVLILSGYFKEMFGQDLPLSFNANLVFEQSYGTIDGDSASCAEIFALLSTLSDLPIDQSFAVTGSLNQKGDVQPIGGVNEKIEGFYDICVLKGLTGKQGVIIPVQNVKDLMLREDVVEAVKNNKFHIYPISKVEEGIEILTGVEAGDPLKKPFVQNSVYELVERKIKYLYAKARTQKIISVKSKKPLDRKKKKS